MNTKRQTVWLVSMLSLMVILSAYYLFTDDANPKDMMQGASHNGVTEATAGTNGGPTVTEVGQNSQSGTIEDEQEVLKKFEESWTAATGGDAINQQLMARNDSFMTEYERLLSIINDTSVKPEDGVAAAEQLSMLEEKDAKITSIEEQLVAEFGKAVIAEENDSYKVVVQSDKLERSQADSIIMMVMDTLDVTPDKISIQYIP
ncbi:SpoIIIAH-like family protein [Paenibacillus tarimensis]